MISFSRSSRVLVRIEPHHFGARRHDRLHGAVAEAHHALDHLALFLLDDAGLLAFDDQGLEFFLGHILLARPVAGRAGRMTPSVTARSSQTSGEATALDQAPSAGAIAAAIGSGAASAMRLGISSPSTSDRKVVNTMTMPKAIAGRAVDERGMQSRDPRRQVVRQRGRAIRAGDDADGGDADLDGGQQLGWIIQQPQRDLRADIALVRHRLQARPARGNDRHLGQRENAVEQDQEDKDRSSIDSAARKAVCSRAPQGPRTHSFCDTCSGRSTGVYGAAPICPDGNSPEFKPDVLSRQKS